MGCLSITGRYGGNNWTLAGGESRKKGEQKVDHDAVIKTAKTEDVKQGFVTSAKEVNEKRFVEEGASYHRIVQWYFWLVKFDAWKE